MAAELSGETFVCAGCGGTFPKRNDEEWSDEMAWAEFNVDFPDHDDPLMVCDDCHTLVSDWAKQKGLM